MLFLTYQSGNFTKNEIRWIGLVALCVPLLELTT